jgi:hypothetical protein
MMLVARNKARRESERSNGSSSAKKNFKGGGVQVGLRAFFKRPSDTKQTGTMTKRQKTPPTSPDHSQSEVETITIDE